MKEIYDYYTLKSPDDSPIYKLRNEYNEMQTLKSELIKLYPEYREISNNLDDKSQDKV